MGACEICQIQKENEIKTNSLENSLALEKNLEKNIVSEPDYFYNDEHKEKAKKKEQLSNNFSNYKSNQNYSSKPGYNYKNKGDININIANFNGLKVPLDLINEAKKSLCKINIKTIKENKIVNGFFASNSYSKNYLIVNYNIKYEDIPNREIELEIYNHKKIKLRLSEYNFKYFPTEEITIIKIEKNEDIFKNIKFLIRTLNSRENFDFNKQIFVFSIKNTFDEEIIYIQLVK